MLFKTIGFLISSLSISVFAATNGTLALSGSVAKSSSIVITPTGTANTSLDILAGQSNVKVGSAAETSNDLSGYTISISSPTGGFLQNSGDVTKKTAYTISYNGGGPVTPTVGGVSVKNVSSLAGLVTNNSDININVTAFATAPSGTYSDTLTVTISNN